MGVNQSARGIESSLDEEGQWYFYINFACYSNFMCYNQFWGRHCGQSCKFCSYVLSNSIALGGYQRFGLICCFYPEDGGTRFLRKIVNHQWGKAIGVLTLILCLLYWDLNILRWQWFKFWSSGLWYFVAVGGYQRFGVTYCLRLPKCW